MSEWLIGWLALWPFWAAALVLLPAILMSPGRGCCTPTGPCWFCETGTAPAEITVTIAGWGQLEGETPPCLEGSCTAINGDYVLPKTYAVTWCSWGAVNGTEFYPTGMDCLDYIAIFSQIIEAGGIWYLEHAVTSLYYDPPFNEPLQAIYRLELGLEPIFDCSLIEGEAALVSENFSDYISCDLTGSTVTSANTG